MMVTHLLTGPILVTHGDATSGFAPSRARATSELKGCVTILILVTHVTHLSLYRLTRAHAQSAMRNLASMRHQGQR